MGEQMWYVETFNAIELRQVRDGHGKVPIKFR